MYANNLRDEILNDRGSLDVSSGTTIIENFFIFLSFNFAFCFISLI